MSVRLDRHQQRFIRLVDDMSRSRHRYTVFRDFCELAALALSNTVDRSQYEQREARYLDVIKGYTKDEAACFPQMLACLTLSLEERMHDSLGQLFMALELGNDRAGQYFTPYEVSQLLASMLCGDMQEKCRERGFVRVMEPAAGAGGMVIALAHTLLDAGINYQQAMHATCIDIDAAAAHMAYVQLSLLHLPAIVIHGNALSMEQWSHWFTPAHVLNCWNTRLKQIGDDQSEQENEFASSVLPETGLKQVREVANRKTSGQLTLF